MDKYVSIRLVLDNILDHPLLKDLSFERAVNYAISFIQIVGCPNIFLERTQVIHIDDYRGVLPCDFESIVQVRTHNCGTNYRVFRHTTDSFHMSDNKQESVDLTYKIQGNVIYTSMKEGDIEIVYNAVKVDQDGYPMIPDSATFIRALELYIKKQCFTILFDLGKITPQVYNNVLQEYAWAVGKAQNDLKMPTIDQMQAITNSLNTLIPRVTEHSTGFVNTGSMEKLKVK